MVTIKFHINVETQGAVAVGSSAVLGHMVILNNSDARTEKLSVSSVGLNPHLSASTVLANDVHIQNRDKAVPGLLKNLIIVSVIKNQKSRLLLLASLQNRQINLKRHRLLLDVFDDSMKLRVVNVDVGNLHACNVA
jgi:hypothetical protein